IPQSWTVFWELYPWDSYHYIELGGQKDTVVQPYLDHPPLFSIMVGGWTIITGNATSAAFDWAVLRFPMIVISMLTILFTGLFVDQVFGRKQAWLTVICYAVLPVAVLSARIIAAEHVMVMLLILGLWLIARYSDHLHQHPKILFILYLISFLAPLLKLSGIALPLIFMLFLWRQRNYKNAALMLGAGVLGILTYIAYGYHYDSQLLFSILSKHSERPQTFWYFFTLFGKPDIGYYGMADAFAIVGVVASLFIGITGPKLKDWLLVPWLMLTLVFVTIAPIELYGWYKYLSFPLIAVGLGYAWDQLLKRELGWAMLLLPALLVVVENTYRNWWIVTDGRKFLIAIAFAPLLIFYLFPKLQNSNWYLFWVIFLFVLSVILQVIWTTTTLLAF
ncbi:glycosyltransferase family 39 protein, partial [Candidatus Woesebacteria bacterium]|nr:glycosyltransferase family 39 protein [Candidatus Woesebacteria bacterium]